MLGRDMVVDRPLKEQVQEQRRIAVGRTRAVDGSLFREDLSGGLTDAADPCTDVVEDRRLARARRTRDDGAIRSRHRDSLPSPCMAHPQLLGAVVT
jgi:hypothetical protein